MAKAIIYVPWILVDAFKLDAEEHELEMKFLYNDLAGNAVFEAEGNELENPEWMKELEEVEIEVSVYSEILKEVWLCGTTKNAQSHTDKRKHLNELQTTSKRLSSY